ncbi:MAG: hypothetical protein Q8N88_04260 [Nanoarchaeota archaeon]|nr:hypothetical protein [Nanoarchaeota archaeon]
MNYSLEDIKAWFIGESEELKKWIGEGYFNHIFVVENNNVTVYYDNEEAEKVWRALEKNFSEEFFDKLCDFYFEQIENQNPDNFEILVKIWPALSIFDEISKYPEDFANEYILRRLIRIRKSTQNFYYRLLNKNPQPKNYIFFKGNIFNHPLEEFVKLNDIIITNGKHRI